MKTNQSILIKGISTLSKCILKLLPFSSPKIIDILKLQMNQYAKQLDQSKLEISQSQQHPSINTTLNNSIAQILQLINKYQKSIRIKSISHHRYKSNETDKPTNRHIELDNIQHQFVNHNIKHVPLMSMKWKQINNNKISKEIVPNATVDLDGVALLASTIPKLQLSIDRINETQLSKRNRYKNTSRKNLSHRVSYQSQKRKAFKQHKIIQRNPQEEDKQQIFLKSYQASKLPRNYKIERLF